LFTVRASHLYLRPAGKLAFVLPLAVLSRGQFEKFRRGSFGSYCIAWDEAWTMDDSVTPLFPVPACAVFGRKRAIAQKMPDKVRAYSGSLPMRDAPEELADEQLSVREGADAPKEGQFSGGSVYRESFRNGATLYPRMLCFVERVALGRLGADPSAPLVSSRRNSGEKAPWRSVESIRGQVESHFLRPVLFGESILPYRVFETFEGVIPVDEKHEPLSSEAALNEKRAFEKLGSWMKQAETQWDLHKAVGTNLTLIEQLDYHGKLAAQFPIAQLRIVYAKSGTLPAACVIRDNRTVIDHKLYWAKPADEGEAGYLCTILNSETCRARAAQYQARGQFGARDFDKVIWNLPIPRYNAKLKLHRDLAEAGKSAEETAALVILKEGEKFQRARKRVRDALIANGIAGEIEKLVEKLLGPVTDA
jgi:hypothetical protein